MLNVDKNARNVPAHYIASIVQLSLDSMWFVMITWPWTLRVIIWMSIPDPREPMKERSVTSQTNEVKALDARREKVDARGVYSSFVVYSKHR